MNLRLPSTLLAGSIALALSGCSHTPSNQLTFDPSSGDEHSYLMLMHMGADGFGEHISNQALVNYKVKHASRSRVDMGLTFDLYRLHSNGFRINSNKYPSSKDRKRFFQLMSSGFDISYDAKTGKVIKLAGRDKTLWQHAIEENGERMRKTLQQGMAAPGVMATIPAREGATVKLNSFNGFSAQLVVTNVTANELAARVETVPTATEDKKAKPPVPVDGMDLSQAKVFGYITFDRETTWLKSMVLQAEVPVSSYGHTTTLHTQIMMLPPEKAGQIVKADAQFTPRFYFTPVPIWDIDKKTTAAIKDPIPYDQGFIDPRRSQENSQTVRYRFISSTNEYGDRVELTDVQPRDEHDQPIDRKLLRINQTPNGGAFYNNIADAIYNMMPLGWATSKDTPKIASYTATARFFPGEIQKTTFDWKPDQTQTIKVGDQNVTITPMKDNIYHLHADNTENSSLITRFGGLEGSYSSTLPLELLKNTPAWVKERTLMAIRMTSSDTDIMLNLDNTPHKVTLYSSHLADKPSHHKPITIVPLTDYLKDPSNPPPYPTDVDVDQTHTDDDKDAEFSVDSLRPKLLSGQGLQVDMPLTWDKACQLQVDKGFKVNGHPVKWVKQPNYNENIATYKLSTDDGKQQYFYGQSVTTSIHCNGSPKWKRIDFKQDPQRPWLVDIASIAPNADHSVPFNQFISAYRFKVTESWPIAFVDAHSGSYFLESATLKDVLLNDKWLRLGGYPKIADKLTMVGPAIDQQWTDTFKPLPK